MVSDRLDEYLTPAYPKEKQRGIKMSAHNSENSSRQPPTIVLRTTSGVKTNTT